MPMPLPADDEIEQKRGAVTRYIRYLVRDAGDAEDLTQETLLRAHLQRSTLRDTAALESWLYQIATHISIDRLRQRAAERFDSCAIVCACGEMGIQGSTSSRRKKNTNTP